MTGTDDDLLVVAAGRSGLWVMDAHPADDVYRAAVVDDSGNNDVNVQLNRRFCNDLVFFTIDGTEYLAACFAKKNQSRLRIYDMASVRGVLGNVNPGEWTGGEIQSLHQIKINRRPGPLHPVDPPPKLPDFGLTIGLDVDQESSDRATIYVANWHQGLVRVTVESDNQGGIAVSPIEWGPVFGDGSYYHTQLGENYSDFVWSLDGDFYRQEPPVFTDVAVQNFHGHYLYATVDTLGWVRFDLDGAWSDSMPIEHHEGTPYPPAPAQHPLGEVQFSLGDIDEEDYTYPRQVRVIDLGDKAVLAVNGACSSIVRRLEYRTEGQTYNYSAALFNGIPAEILEPACGAGLVSGGSEAVFVYDLGANGVVPPPLIAPPPPPPLLPPPDPQDPEPVFPLSVPPGATWAMELVPGPVSDQAFLFTQTRDHTTKSRVDLGAGTVVQIGQRTPSQRPTRECFTVTPSVVNPDLLLFTANDGGPPTNGVWALCGSELVNFYSPNAAGGDNRTSNGIFLDHDGQWPVLTPGHEGEQFMLATGTSQRYGLRLLDPGDPCGSPPVEPTLIHTWLLTSREHRLGNNHRWFYQSMVNDEYDADVGRRLVFLSGSSSVEGILVIDRLALENWVFSEMDSGSANTQLNINDVVGTVVLTALNTEPEFDNVPGVDMEPMNDDFLQKQTYPGHPKEYNIAGKAQAYVPRLVKLKSAEAQPVPDKWILVAPCAFLDNGQEDFDELGQQYQSYTDHPGNTGDGWEAPDEFSDLRRLLVRFWDLTDPDDIPPPEASLVAAPELASAIYAQVEELDGRTYLFLADYGGRVHAYDITDVCWDTQNPAKLVEVADVVSSYTDDLANCVWEIEVDRAEWSSGGTNYEQIYIYAAVERVGVQVFRFDPSCPAGERLKKVGVIQTPGNPRSLVIRDDTADKSLVISDGEAGIRVLKYNF